MGPNKLRSVLQLELMSSMARCDLMSQGYAHGNREKPDGELGVEACKYRFCRRESL